MKIFVTAFFITLENDQVKITICPDLGGKVTSMVLKLSGKEVLYVPEVIRPTRILPRFYFVAGGIEISFPIPDQLGEDRLANFGAYREFE